MAETMAVRTGRSVQRSALRCNRNTSGLPGAAGFVMQVLNEERHASIERNFVEQVCGDGGLSACLPAGTGAPTERGGYKA